MMRGLTTSLLCFAGLCSAQTQTCHVYTVSQTSTQWTVAIDGGAPSNVAAIAAATTQAVPIFTLSGSLVVNWIRQNVTTPYTGSGLSSMTASLGSVGSSNNNYYSHLAMDMTVTGETGYRTPSNPGDGSSPTIFFTANQNLNAATLTGSVAATFCTSIPANPPTSKLSIVQNGIPSLANGLVTSMTHATRYSVTAGDVLIVPFSTTNPHPTTVSDDHGNSLTQIGTATGNSYSVYLFCEVATVSGSYTFTAAQGGFLMSQSALVMIEYRNLVGCTPDGSMVSATFAAVVTPSVSITTATASDLLFCVDAALPSTGGWIPTASPNFKLETYEPSAAMVFGIMDSIVGSAGTYPCSPGINQQNLRNAPHAGNIIMAAFPIVTGAGTSGTTPEVVAVGDSLSYGPTMAGPQRWPDQGLIAVTTPTYYINLGLGSQGIECTSALCNEPSMVSEWNTLVRPYLDIADRSTVILSFQGGINDFVLDAPTVVQLEGRVTDLLTLAFAAGVQHIIISTATSNGFMGSVYRSTYNAWLVSQAGKVCGLSSCSSGAGDSRIVIADAASDANIGCDNCWTNTTYFINDPHMTAVGYSIWGGYFQQAIQFAESQVFNRGGDQTRGRGQLRSIGQSR